MFERARTEALAAISIVGLMMQETWKPADFEAAEAVPQKRRADNVIITTAREAEELFFVCVRFTGFSPPAARPPCPLRGGFRFVALRPALSDRLPLLLDYQRALMP